MIIKQDSVRKGNTDNSRSRLKSEGCKVLAKKDLRMSRKQAESFYAVHRERPFFGSLVDYMTSGPVVVAALERNNAVATLRKVMGATDPAKADKGTIRKDFGESIEQNAIHGSDSDDNAKTEMGFFFPDL